MPDLNTFNTLHTRVKKYLVDYELENTSQAFDRVALEIILNLSDEEIEDSVTDGNDDGGIDAVYINDRDVHIFNFKYTDDFDKSKNNFPGTEVDKLLATMEGILSQTIEKKTVNDLVWDKAIEIWNLLKSGTINLKFYFCSNKEKLVEGVKSKLETSLNKYRYVEFFYYDQNELVNKLLENKYRKVNGKITFIDKNYFDRSDGPLKAVVATVAANDLVTLVQDSENPEKINESAFDDNCRVYLKRKNAINQNIYETALADDNFKFYYLNNGITIICQKCEYQPNVRSPLVTLTNLQIVNGGQTTHALFEAAQVDPEKINDVLVLVRICETNDLTLTERISETTNSQTPVSNRDLRANDGIQKKLEEQFKHLGYFYERKKNQYFDEEKSKRLDNELLGQLYYAFYNEKPFEAKNQKFKIFSADTYELIFNEEKTTAEKLLLPYQIFLPFDAMKKSLQTRRRKREEIRDNETFIIYATFHLLFAVKVISEIEKIDLNNKFLRNETINKAVNYLKNVISEERNRLGEEYNHSQFFREQSTNNKIRDYIKKNSESLMNKTH